MPVPVIAPDSTRVPKHEAACAQQRRRVKLRVITSRMYSHGDSHGDSHGEMLATVSAYSGPRPAQEAAPSQACTSESAGFNVRVTAGLYVRVTAGSRQRLADAIKLFQLRLPPPPPPPPPSSS